MKRLNLSLAVIIYVLGVSFLLSWRPWEALAAFYPWSTIVFGLTLIAFVVFQKTGFKILNTLLDLPAKVWMLACAFVPFSISLLIAYGPQEGIPHVPDDFCYLWQARTFALGKLFVDSHALPEFFDMLFFVNDGMWYSLFQPGWPMVLMFGTLINFELIINPIFGGIAVALTYPIGKRIFGDRIAKIGMVFLAFSPMHIAICAAMVAHALTITLTEICVLMAFRLTEKDRLKDAIVLAAALGFMFTTRALNSIAISAVVASFLAYFAVCGKVSWRNLFAVIPIVMIFVSLQLGYNYKLTGNAFYWPQDRYFDMTEPKQGCHSLGFGTKVGCPNVHPGDDFPDGFTPLDAVGVLHKRMGTYLLMGFGWQALFLFLGVPFLTKRYGWGKYFLLSIFLSLIVAYFFWYFHGQWGRYYYESSFGLFLLVAAALVIVNERLQMVAESSGKIKKRILKAIIPAVALSYLLFNIFVLIPVGTQEILAKSWFNVDGRTKNMVEHIPQKSLIFFEGWYQLGFLMMRPGLPSDRIFARDLGEHNTQLMQYYPDWNYYHYDTDNNKIVKIEKKVKLAPILVEAEFKAPIADSSGEYAFADNFMQAKLKASGKFSEVLTFLPNSIGSYMAFNQYIFKSGKYDIQMRLPTGPDRGQFEMSIDNQVCDTIIDLYSENYGFKSVTGDECGIFELEKGQHKIKFKVAGINKLSDGLIIGVDRMIFSLAQ